MAGPNSADRPALFDRFAGEVARAAIDRKYRLGEARPVGSLLVASRCAAAFRRCPGMPVISLDERGEWRIVGTAPRRAAGGSGVLLGKERGPTCGDLQARPDSYTGAHREEA